MFEKTGLTCSAGIACNPMLAKICSDKNKPNGQFCLPFNREAIIEFMKELPVRKIPFIGKVSEKILKEVFGINTGGDLYEKRGLLFSICTKKSSSSYVECSLGISSTQIPNSDSTMRKSIG